MKKQKKKSDKDIIAGERTESEREGERSSCSKSIHKFANVRMHRNTKREHRQIKFILKIKT